MLKSKEIELRRQHLEQIKRKNKQLIDKLKEDLNKSKTLAKFDE